MLLQIGRTTIQNLGQVTIGDVGAIDLSAAFDTGSSDTDNLTRLDNSSIANALEFSVTGATPGAIVPRMNGHVLLIDVGLSAHYGARLACLVIEGGVASALHRGTRVPDPPAADPRLPRTPSCNDMVIRSG